MQMLTLSRCDHNIITLSMTATFCDVGIPPQVLQDAQQCDPVTNPLYDQLSRSHEKPTDAKWRKQHLYHYLRLWLQLLLVEGIVAMLPL